MIDKKYHNVFFLGAGGIGMSALARYFMAAGKNVAGYDRTASDITRQLTAEGMSLFFRDDEALLPEAFTHSGQTLVVFTPAVNEDNRLLSYFRSNGFRVMKRSQVLGEVSTGHSLIAVAGTHGKTTVSTLIAHLLHESNTGCVALLGGISKNYNTNYLHAASSRYFVTEADEFDRSFLNLFPDMAVITSADADHLDVYGNQSALKQSFGDFIRNLKPHGKLFIKEGLALDISPVDDSNLHHYGLSAGDWYAGGIHIFPGHSVFNLITPSGQINDLTLGIPGIVNVENAVAASAVALSAGVSPEALRRGLQTFKGIRRRFDVRFTSEQTVYIDDYAHHPNEINALVDSVRKMYPGKKILGIFQPHLYSRTRDFREEFARSLDRMDEVILLDIYPAREKPIEGVSSDMIFSRMKLKHKKRCGKEELLDILSGKVPGVLLTIGAGDIDRLAEPITQMLRKTLKST